MAQPHLREGVSELLCSKETEPKGRRALCKTPQRLHYREKWDQQFQTLRLLHFPMGLVSPE